MKIEIGSYAGFCRGVRHAVDRSFQIARSSHIPVVTDGELIHNPQTLALLSAHGIQPLTADETLKDKTVIVRAHGVTPARLAELKSNAGTVINLTCRDVAKVQAIIKKHSAAGAAVIIFGKPDHPEVIGLTGFAQQAYVVQRAADVDALPPLGNVLLVSQTTMEQEQFALVATRVRERFAGAEVVNTICAATEERQKEVKEMAARNDAIIVVGGSKSSNTKRLVEIAAAHVDAFAVETVADALAIDISQYTRIGITAGASTPDWLIEEVAAAVREKALNPVMRLGELAVRFAVYSNLFVAAGVLLLSFAVADISGMRYPLIFSLIGVLYYFSMSVLNNYTNRHTLRLHDRRRYDFVYRFRILFTLVFVAAIAATLIAARAINRDIFMLTMFSLTLGIAYNMSFLPIPEKSRLLFFRLRGIPAFKSFVISVAVMVLLNGLPALVDTGRVFAHRWDFFFSCLFVLTLILTRQTLLEFKTAQTDRISGGGGLVTLFGRKPLLVILFALQAAGIIAFIIGCSAGIMPYRKLLYLVPLICNIVLIALASNVTLLRTRFGYEFLIDSNLFIAGLIGLAHL
ncbi:MAG: 4-hydroxy-3-methylbut-2-enyl diphosphate reductase [Spirochaetes bacterium]|nr:4-hydroxy-3-methylbut-2-enyl diphosphate reductase [Spirochaetota bacterium]